MLAAVVVEHIVLVQECLGQVVQAVVELAV
jgi:hypothetical protein